MNNQEELIRREILGIKEYIPGKPIEETQRELGLTDVIKLASNENPLGPAKEVLAAIQETAPAVYLYPDSNRYHLKQALAEHLKLDPAWIFPGNGSDEVIKLFAEAYFCPGDEVIVAKPTFSVYEYAARLMGAEVVTVPAADGYRHDLEGMAAAVTARTKAVFICNPNNPTGTIISRQQLRDFFDRLPQRVLLVIDEAYSDYVDDEADYGRGRELLESGRVLILRTFSKIYGMAGLRVGYGIAHPALLQWLERVKEPFSINIIAQRAAIAALQAKEHVALSHRLNAEGKKQLYRGLTELGLTYLPTQANFILFQVPVESKLVYDGMLRRGVILRMADSFGLPRHLRVTVGTPEQNTRFLQALKEVLASSGS